MALLAPALRVRRVRVLVEHRLGECAPADIAHERGFFFLPRRAVFFGKRLQNADYRDIRRDLFLRRALADPVLGGYAEIEARTVTPPRRLVVRI